MTPPQAVPPAGESLPIAGIRIGPRHRREFGDIASLARSIEEVGLLHAVVVTPAGDLVAGERRLRAVQMLGRDSIPVRVVDLDSIVRGEHAENTYRKDFTLSEGCRDRRGTRTARTCRSGGATAHSRAHRTGPEHS